MRRKIELFIGGMLADIDSQDFILYNYAFTDLESPTAVKNSFSKQISLPATPRNLAIFGHPERAERITEDVAGWTGTAFSSGRKTPFEIRDEAQCIIESGYVRLDSVTRKGRIVTGMKITLFGGLGSFLYSLSYTAAGEKKTLYDILAYRLPGDLTITATNVNAAWVRLRTHDQSQGIVNKNDIVNFAPAYNGLPEGDFSPDKGIGRPEDIGLASEITEGQGDDAKTYTASGGLVMVNLKNAHDEWAVRDFRSYLQRPVVSMTAFLEAIARPEMNGGFSVDYSLVPTASYINVWKTLPMLQALGDIETRTGTISFRLVRQGRQTANLGAWTYDTRLPVGSTVDASFSFRIGLEINAGAPADLVPAMGYERTDGKVYAVYFVQMVSRSGNVIADATDALCLYGGLPFAAAEVAAYVGYTPLHGKSVGRAVEVRAARVSGQKYSIGPTIGNLSFNMSGLAAGEYTLEYKCYSVATRVEGGIEVMSDFHEWSVLAMYGNVGNNETYLYSAVDIEPATYTASGNYTSTQKVRSQSRIPWAKILGSAHTPAEYLVSFCKINGLVMAFNPATKAVTIMPRDSWFTGEVTDLSGRIDTLHPVTIDPRVMKKKWYELKGPMVKGGYADDYEKRFGVQYGIQRVNTGYDFDAATEDIMSSLVLKGAVTFLASGPYWNYLRDSSGKLVPSVFLDAGNTYTLWGGDGESKDFSVQVPSAGVSIEYMNRAHPGYDKSLCPKLQLCDASGKSLDGADVLCRYVGSVEYEHFSITDDTDEMLAMSNGVGCWWLKGAQVSPLQVPVFHRYNAIQSTGVITHSLDFGIPREIEIPGASFDTDTASVYLRSWRAYLADMMDKDTKVMKCRVNLRGMQVGNELLRRFYWYDGALWALNKITNYSLTTWDTVECEFVQVRDTDNYTNGQII